MTQEELTKRRKAARAGTDYSPAAAAESDYHKAQKAAYTDYAAREPFNYSPAADPLYRAYRERYTRDGELAMRDTTAQAAALTGGYANSYAQTVGQQQYGEYLRRLSDAMPQLYRSAYERYTAEGDALLDRINLLGELGDREYSRSRDAISDERYAAQTAAADEKLLYDRMGDAYTRLLALMEKGYEPTDDELADAGLTRAQAELLIKKASSGGSYYRSSTGAEKKKSDSKTDEDKKPQQSSKSEKEKWVYV